MAAVIFVGLSHRDERWPERSLAAFGHDDLLGLSQIGGKPADEGEFESARTRARFRKLSGSFTYVIGN